MEVGSSSSSSTPSVRIVKPADVASTSRGDGAIRGEEGAAVSEEDPFQRSDSVPKLEDLIAGDSRLEELYKGDAELLRAKQRADGEEGNDTEDDEEEDAAGAISLCERGHTLRFLSVAPYTSGACECNRCRQRATGEVYHCATCLFDLCPSCARAPPPATPLPQSVTSSSSVQEIPSSWGQPLLGCTNPSHTLAILEAAPYESGAYLCNLCLKTGDAAVYHCTSCADFDLHPECAKIAREIVSFTHPHRLLLQSPFSRGYNAICDGCLEVLGGSQWVYRCNTSGCDFDIHARCAKYARTISHPIHEEHELVLINESAAVGPLSSVMCDGCDTQVDPKELVYHCEECGFDIHPNCAIGEVVRS
jgi:hypothetical protein